MSNIAELVPQNELLLPLTSTQNESNLLEIGIPPLPELGISDINDAEMSFESSDETNTVADEVNENISQAEIICITKTTKGYPQFHFKYKGKNVFMKYRYSGKYHIVLGCNTKSCPGVAKLKPDKSIILPPDGSSRPKVHLNNEIDQTFESKLVSHFFHQL